MFIPFLLVSFVVVLLLTFVPGKTLAPLVFTTRKTREQLFAAARLQKGQRFVDLGCGKGNLLIQAARRFGAQAIGFEIAPLQFVWSKINVWLSGQNKNITVALADFMTCDLSQADVVYIFLTPQAMSKVSAKLEKELKKGTRVISNSFPIPDWKTQNMPELPSSSPLFFYRMGEHR
jgi:precorrin-6B methylase 2